MIYERFPNWDVDVENGTIYSLLKKKYIGSVDKHGYVRIAKIKGYNHTKLHQYIWMVANGCEIPEGYDIHHIDGNRLNNSIYNLELLTKSKHHNLHIEKRGCFKLENNPFFGKIHSEESRKKMSDKKQKKKIIQFNQNNEIINIWNSLSECGKNGFNKSSIWKSCNNNKLYRGFIWKYHEEEKDVA